MILAQLKKIQELDKEQLEKILFKLLKLQKHKFVTIKLINKEHSFALDNATINFDDKNQCWRTKKNIKN